MILANSMNATTISIAMFGSNVIPWFVKSARFCIRVLQSGCLTMSSILNDISNGLRISALLKSCSKQGVGKMLIFNMSKLHQNISKAYGYQYMFYTSKKPNHVFFRRPKDFKICQHMAEITYRSKYQRSVVHPVYHHMRANWNVLGSAHFVQLGELTLTHLN